MAKRKTITYPSYSTNAFAPTRHTTHHSHRLLARDVTTEDLDLDPVGKDERPVTDRVEGGDVSGTPEKHGSSTTRGVLAVEGQAQVGNSLLGTNVGERTLVGVVERGELGGAVELLDDTLDLCGVGGGVGAELSKLLLELVLLADLVEHLCEVGTLLGGDLGSGGVLGGSAVTEGVDALSTQEREVIVDEETTALGLSRGEGAHEVPGDLARGVTGSPNEETVGDLVHLLVGVLDDDVLVGDVLDHGTGKEVNLLVLELLLGVLDELLGEGRKDVGKSLDQSDLEAVGDLRVPLLEIVLG